MSNQQQQDFSDTVQIQVPDAGEAAAAAPEGIDKADLELWPEATDFQCSQSASLFAASQTGTLNVV
jgi:hypothetical protein